MEGLYAVGAILIDRDEISERKEFTNLEQACSLWMTIASKPFYMQRVFYPSGSVNYNQHLICTRKGSLRRL